MGSSHGNRRANQIAYSITHKRSQGIFLRNVSLRPAPDGSGGQATIATVFIPDGKQHVFMKKLSEYSIDGVKNKKLIASIEDIRTACMETVWLDDAALMPTNIPVWREIWLHGNGDELKMRFEAHSAHAKINVQDRRLEFPDRTVVVGLATKKQLEALLDISGDIAEFRRAKETADFFLGLNNKDQTDWVENLRGRMHVDHSSDVAVCILGTGVNTGHDLLQPVIQESDCHTVEPDWGTSDHDGHGTRMCGIVTFGDLTEPLQNDEIARINHRVESSKILPPDDKENRPELYGEITIQGVSRAEINAPERRRIRCMAVTSEDGRDFGRPSSWSGLNDIR